MPSDPDQPRLPCGSLLILTGDELLLDDLLRLAAATGLAPEVEPSVDTVRATWRQADLVLLGADLAPAAVARRLPRRGDVYVVARDRTPGRDADGSSPDPMVTLRSAVEIGAEGVLELPDGERHLRELLADAADHGPGGRDNAPVVCLLGGCGGVGATTFAAMLGAVSAADGRRVLLVDGDALAGGIDLTLGSEEQPGARWPTLASTSGRVSPAALHDGLPRSGGLAVLSWERGVPTTVSADLMGRVLAAGRRGGDLVVVDLPRRFDEASRVALDEADLTVLVIRGDVRGIAAACAMVPHLQGGRAGAVVRAGGSSGIDAETVAEAVGLPLLARLRDDRAVAGDIDLGRGPWGRLKGPLARACGSVLAAVPTPARRSS